MSAQSITAVEARFVPISAAELKGQGGLTFWTIPPFAQDVQEYFDCTPVLSPELPPEGGVLCVVGGGGLIDEAKLLAHQSKRWDKLIALPLIYGSGAEVSPISVTHSADGAKEITVDPALVPESFAIWPQSLSRFSDQRLRAASGDVWAHALEGFWSPLADTALRQEGVLLIEALLKSPELRDPAWFDLSARACSLQSRSSVGLVHGIAHVVESAMRESAEHSSAIPGHAALCSTFLWPVFSLHMEQSPKVRALLEEYGFDVAALTQEIKARFDAELYARVAPELQKQWTKIIRDPCTRTNPMLIRKSSLSFFESFGVQS